MFVGVQTTVYKIYGMVSTWTHFTLKGEDFWILQSQHRYNNLFSTQHGAEKPFKDHILMMVFWLWHLHPNVCMIIGLAPAKKGFLKIWALSSIQKRKVKYVNQRYNDVCMWLHTGASWIRKEKAYNCLNPVLRSLVCRVRGTESTTWPAWDKVSYWRWIRRVMNRKGETLSTLRISYLHISSSYIFSSILFVRFQCEDWIYSVMGINSIFFWFCLVALLLLQNHLHSWYAHAQSVKHMWHEQILHQSYSDT